jgi:cell division protein FtsI (penicillin-binding protein 3)
MYVEDKQPFQNEFVKDSSNFFYAGYSSDVKNIFQQLHLTYTDSAQQNFWSQVRDYQYKPLVTGNTVKPKLMPDLKGLGLKDALYLLENIGIKVVIDGRGKVANQSIPPGTGLKNGMTVYLDFG